MPVRPCPADRTLFPYTTLFRSEQEATAFRAVALTQQLPRMLQGTASALAMNQVEQFGIRGGAAEMLGASFEAQDRKSTRLNSSHLGISYAVFCLKKKKKENICE